MSDSPDLERATRLTPLGPGRFGLEVPDGWQQGRGAFGGLVFAALCRATEAFEAPGDRALRSLTGILPGPTLTGPAELTVEPLRVTPSQASYAAALRQDGELKAHAVLLFGRARAPDAERFVELTPPELPPWESLERLPVEGVGPVFTQHVDLRTVGPFPYVSGDAALAQGWVRFLKPSPPGGERLPVSAWLAALADAWWPALFTRMSAPRPIATVAFTLQPVDLQGFSPARPLAYRARTWLQQDGHAVEQRELYGEDGRLVALNQQTIAVVR